MKNSGQTGKMTALQRVSQSETVFGSESQTTKRANKPRPKAQLSAPARERLAVLELADQTGVTAACRQYGISRPTLYKWKARYSEFGAVGLEDLPPIAKYHPATTPTEVEAHISRLSNEHPGYGSQRIQNELEGIGIQVSRATVEKIRRQQGLRRQHIKKVRVQVGKENRATNAADMGPTAPSELASTYPGQLLCQTVLHIGHFKPIGHVFLHTIIDTYTSMAWIALSIDYNTGERSKRELARNVVVETLLQEVVGWYKVRGLRVESVLTDERRDFYGVPLGRKGGRYFQSLHPYSLLLERLGIQHQTKDLKRPQTHLAFERFRCVLRERLLDVELPAAIVVTDTQVAASPFASLEYRRRSAQTGSHPVSLGNGMLRLHLQRATKAPPMTIVRDYKRRIEVEQESMTKDRHYTLLRELEGKIQRWVAKYNNQLKRPHAAAPNFGRTPKQVLDDYQLLLANQTEAPPTEKR